MWQWENIYVRKLAAKELFTCYIRSCYYNKGYTSIINLHYMGHPINKATSIIPCSGLWSERAHTKTYPNQNVPNFGQNVPTFLVKTYPVYQNVPKLLVKTYLKYFFLIFNKYFYFFWLKCFLHIGQNVPNIYFKEKKKEIWPSPMTKPPIPTENSKTKGQHTNATKNFDYTTIADRLRTVSWSNKSSNSCG